MAGNSKSITVNTDDNTVMIEQTIAQPVPAETGLNIGGVSLNTDLPWYGDAMIVLLIVALVYCGKKCIDRWFRRSE
jgi:hypothetical protein|tara:strand:- start:621 stop:848 length:228 start_codon:yes stop_codon:yes gene_type:complete